MTQTKNSSTGSSLRARRSTFLATGEKTGYFVLDAAAIIQIDLPGYTVTNELTDSGGPMTRRERLSADPKKATALQRARRRIAKELGHSPAFSVTQLRLDAGLSQAELASMIGTQQPAIARLEKGQTEPQISTIEKLAEAFGVPAEKVFNAFLNTRSAIAKR